MRERRFYRVAGMTIRVESELPIGDDTFAAKFRRFEVDGPGEDNVHLVHRFSLPEAASDYGREVYRKPPWVIYKNGSGWVYILETSPDPAEKAIRQISFMSGDHTRAQIYNGELVRQAYQKGGMGALTMSPTDQVLLARLLADRDGCYIHSDGVSMDGQGYLFVGHSGAGKSTIAGQFMDRAEILCDDRMIVRKWPEGYTIHGNWSHGTMPVVSAVSAPLEAVFFIEQASENRVVPVANKMEAISMMLGCLIKPMVTRDWWEKMLALVVDMVGAVPCYRLMFDRGGGAVEVVENLRI